VSEAYRTIRARTSRILPQSFDLQDATALGGLNELARFVGRLGLDRLLAEHLGKAKAPWATWSLDRIARVMLDAHFAGIERLYHFEDLETEPLLCAQHGVERLPDLKTLYRDLLRFEEPELLQSLSAVSRQIVLDALARTRRAVLEFDSTVEVLYGTQEGARIGPNAMKRGRASYHPLLARDRISDLIVHHQLRPGDTGAVTDGNTFVHRTLDVVKESGKKREILARADSAFESDAILSTFERRGVGYVVKRRITTELSVLISFGAPKVWRKIPFEGDGEIEAFSFDWKRPTAWKQDRRIVVLRKRELDRIQGRLFDEIGWSYSAYVTNLDWSEGDVARFYDKRADVERTICEAKNDLHIGHVPTASFAANAADLALKLLARNMLVLYRDRELKLPVRIRIATLRRRFLAVAGRVVRHSGRLLLRLARRSPLAALLDPVPA
jgi:hypothetical protein